MSHRLGSLITPPSPVTIGPGSGTEVSPNRWRVTFSPPPHALGTKFLMLHFTGAVFGSGDRIEVNVNYGTDIFDASSGPDFWSRPIEGNSVGIDFIDGGSGTGHASLSQYGRGEGLQGGGATNANGDVFLIDGAFVDPTFFNANGVCPSGTNPSWENVDCLPAGLMREAAKSVGMILEADAAGAKISSCSAALIDSDLILTAGHCVSGPLFEGSSSFTLDFQTDCAGNRPATYSLKFHKVKRIVKTGFAVPGTGAGVSTGSGLDYAIVQIETPPGGLGVTPLPIRASFSALGEELFVIHHPRGATKKVSRKPTDPSCQVLSVGGILSYACDSDNGSSGSPVIDMVGRVVAVNDWAPGACNNQGQASAAFLQDFLTETPPPKDVDVVLVLDRSGSMSLSGLSGASKMDEAQAAAALFIDLLRTDQTHRAGLVTFSTTASTPPEFALSAVSETNKTTLIGPPPDRDDGIVAGISPGGTTTIGGGLQAGQAMLPAPTPTTNTPAILLLTDGLQNTPPMISAVALGATRLCVVGFGSEASLDGPLLTTLARNHGGIYTRAGEGLELKKFFVLCFGNIFHTAVAMDPFEVLPADATAAKPIPLQVCAEELITVVLSWERPSEDLILSLRTPAGNTLTRSTPGVVSSSGSTWVYFRVALPFAGEREGTWEVQVSRLRGGGEFPPPLPEERFFVTAVADGGPYFRPVESGRIYTGDTVNPKVVLREPSGQLVPADVRVDVTMPREGTGNVLTAAGLGATGELGGDQIDARTNTLIGLERSRGTELIPTITQSYELFGDGEMNGTGSLEPDGVYGNPLGDITRYEGNYTFHAKATYGETCTGTRETTWSMYVHVGIDPEQTETETETLGTRPDGTVRVRIRFTPRDRFGNYLGPGRLDAFQVDPQPGSTLTGGVNDEGDGSYTQDVDWDPESAEPPTISVSQPGRPPLVIPLPTPAGQFVYSVKFLCGVQEDCPCECAPVRPGKYATEINIHNFHERDVRVRKSVIPLVFSGAAAGREPKTVGRRAADSIVIPRHAATMDDCCRIMELLLGAKPSSEQPITLGFLEIVSPVELQVSAVYTVSDLASGSTSIDVENIAPKRIRR